MISTDNTMVGFNPTSGPLDGSSKSTLANASLNFIRDNIQQITGISSLEIYKEKEREFFHKRSIQSGPVAKTFVNTTIRQINKDGNCLLNAVREGLKLNISHQQLRKEVVKAIKTNSLSFKMELYEYFDGCGENNPLFSKFAKKDLVEALLLEISNPGAKNEKIEHATHLYLKIIEKDKTFLGGSALEVLHQRFKVNLDIRDEKFKNLAQFYDPRFKQSLSLRLKNQHYDVIKNNSG